MNIRKTLIVLTVTVLLLAGCGPRKSDDSVQVLRFSLIPADDADEMMRAYEPVKEYLAAKLGIPVELTVTTDYTAAIEAMRSGHTEMGWFGPFSYVLAAKEAGAEAVAIGVRRDSGLSTYRSVIVTGANSGISELEDLKGRTFAFVDPASTSGNLMPRKMMIENGIDPDVDLSTVMYSGSHNAGLLAVANGSVDACATSDNSYNRMVEAGEIDSNVSVIIHESDPIPGSPIAVRGDLPDALKKQIQEALVAMDEQTITKVDGWGNIARYEAVGDSTYDIIRKTAEILQMDLSQ